MIQKTDDRGFEGGQSMACVHGGGRPKAIGVFHPVKTRDYQAELRDGHPYYMVNALDSDPYGGQLFEICFGDGAWMLAVEADLQPSGPLPFS